MSRAAQRLGGAVYFSCAEAVALAIRSEIRRCRAQLLRTVASWMSSLGNSARMPPRQVPKIRLNWVWVAPVPVRTLCPGWRRRLDRRARPPSRISVDWSTPAASLVSKARGLFPDKSALLDYIVLQHFFLSCGLFLLVRPKARPLSTSNP